MADTTSLNVVQASTINVLGAERLGVAVIAHQLKLAAKFYAGETTVLVQEISAAVAFIWSDQLEITIKTFGVGMSPERLRNVFEAYVEQRST